MLQCVAVCYSVLQVAGPEWYSGEYADVAVYCDVVRCVAGCRTLVVKRRVCGCCSVLQCGAVCCRLQDLSGKAESMRMKFQEFGRHGSTLSLTHLHQFA